jgi:predicted DNA-binding protein
MNRQKRNDMPFLLNLSHDMFDRLAIAAHEQNVTKTQFLRQAVERNLSHYEKHEQPVFQQLFIKGLT